QRRVPPEAHASAANAPAGSAQRRPESRDILYSFPCGISPSSTSTAATAPAQAGETQQKEQQVGTDEVARGMPAERDLPRQRFPLRRALQHGQEERERERSRREERERPRDAPPSGPAQELGRDPQRRADAREAPDERIQ